MTHGITHCAPAGAARLPAAAGLVLILILAGGPPVGAQSIAALDSGEEVYRSACAACHGPDGRGAPQTAVGFDVPVPDFTDCSFNSREPSADWFAIGHDGGPVRAFDARMPAFGRVLTQSQLEMAVAYIKDFCDQPAWPPGELNLPRALVTEKAFPEDEAVLSTTIASGTFVNEFLYERRIGARTQYEIKVPIAVQEGDAGWRRGLGDVAAALKHVFHHSLERGNIFSAAAEIVLPTGKENEGLGRGVTVFEPFAAFGQMLPRDGFVQAQTGFEIPLGGERSNEFFWRALAGKSFVQGEFGRTWSPMVEVLGARDLDDGATVLWDVVPQMQVTLNRRQHIMMSVGIRIPVNERAARGNQVLTYLLWDWFDGGLFDGW
jgi:mono/diheme cytochrome c family protein